VLSRFEQQPVVYEYLAWLIGCLGGTEISSPIFHPCSDTVTVRVSGPWWLRSSSVACNRRKCKRTKMHRVILEDECLDVRYTHGWQHYQRTVYLDSDRIPWSLKSFVFPCFGHHSRPRVMSFVSARYAYDEPTSTSALETLPLDRRAGRMRD